MNRDGQQSGILGTLFTSCIFPTHQKNGVISTRTILGGSIAPEIMKKDQQELQKMVIEHHEKLFGSLRSPPLHITMVKHHDAIPRYEKGHLQLQQKITQFHMHHPTIRLSGNHIFGVAVKDCIKQSKHSVLDFLTHQREHHA